MTPKSPSAVLIHGHHLQAPGWEELVWGTDNLKNAGRIPRGIEVAVKEDVELIIWGTGASTDTSTGKKESEYTLALAIERSAEISAYVDVEKEAVDTLLKTKSVLQLETTNTKEEVREALEACKQRGIHTLYLVSSPTHVPRCLLTAIQMQDEFPGILLCGIAADSSVAHWPAKDVAIIEPSHRPDRSEVPFNLIAKKLASSRKYPERAQKLYEDIKLLIDSFDEETKKDAHT